MGGRKKEGQRNGVVAGMQGRSGHRLGSKAGFRSKLALWLMLIRLDFMEKMTQEGFRGVM